MINKIHKKRGWYFGVFTNRDVMLGIKVGRNWWWNELQLAIYLPFICILAGYDFGVKYYEA